MRLIIRPGSTGNADTVVSNAFNHALEPGLGDRIVTLNDDENSHSVREGTFTFGVPTPMATLRSVLVLRDHAMNVEKDGSLLVITADSGMNPFSALKVEMPI